MMKLPAKWKITMLMFMGMAEISNLSLLLLETMQPHALTSPKNR